MNKTTPPVLVFNERIVSPTFNWEWYAHKFVKLPERVLTLTPYSSLLKLKDFNSLSTKIFSTLSITLLQLKSLLMVIQDLACLKGD